jgi:hypothetical protein
MNLPPARLRVLRLNSHSRLGVIQPHANLVEVRRTSYCVSFFSWMRVFIFDAVGALHIC